MARPASKRDFHVKTIKKEEFVITYDIGQKTTGGFDFVTSLEADSLEEAADKYVQAKYKHKGEVMITKRITGETGKCGTFQAYVKRGHSHNQIGGNFQIK